MAWARCGGAKPIQEVQVCERSNIPDDALGGLLVRCFGQDATGGQDLRPRSIPTDFGEDLKSGAPPDLMCSSPAYISDGAVARLSFGFPATEYGTAHTLHCSGRPGGDRRAPGPAHVAPLIGSGLVSPRRGVGASGMLSGLGGFAADGNDKENRGDGQEPWWLKVRFPAPPGLLRPPFAPSASIAFDLTGRSLLAA
mmetsp:Transcript_13774/g.39357  ORF Transcript_13774/g.39357 Transcript_13774/m.39357 type:complete len:196 (+) Transcript_13774:1-588(+)